MDINDMLGIDPENPVEILAERLVEADEDLLDRLIQIRLEQKLSQDEVGRRLGVGQSAIARIESGDRDPHLSTLRRYALAINADVTHHAVIFKPAQEKTPGGAAEPSSTVEKAIWGYLAEGGEELGAPGWAEHDDVEVVRAFEGRNAWLVARAR